MSAALAVVPEPEPVHLRHFHDGYPLCWPMDREGEFQGSYREADITCTDCTDHLKEEA